MTSPCSAVARSRRTATVVGALLLITACGPAEEEPQEQEDSEEAVNEIPQPELDSDDTLHLPVGMVSPAGHSEGAPIGEDGTIESTEAPGDPINGQDESEQQTHTTEVARTSTFGCEDTISVIETVPAATDDPVGAALDFLMKDPLYYHGEPAFINPLAVSETLEVSTVEEDGDTVTVDLTGEPISRSQCESWQILKQLETTARAASGASSAEILVDGEPLADLLGIQEADDQPLEIREITG